MEGEFWNVIGTVYDDRMQFSIVSFYLTFYCALNSDLDPSSVSIDYIVLNRMNWSNEVIDVV